MPAAKRRRIFDWDDENLRQLALQAHQISGSIDPRVPTHMLLNAANPARPSKRRSAKPKRGDPEIKRMINDRLAPSGLN